MQDCPFARAIIQLRDRGATHGSLYYVARTKKWAARLRSIKWRHGCRLKLPAGQFSGWVNHEQLLPIFVTVPDDVDN